VISADDAGRVSKFEIAEQTGTPSAVSVLRSALSASSMQIARAWLKSAASKTSVGLPSTSRTKIWAVVIEYSFLYKPNDE
jgi:hypothetical protein